MPRILHTADWQLGRHYARFAPEDAALLAEARFEAVEQIAQLARQQSADAVLVAGDVFDMQGVSERTLRRPFEAMKAFTGPWVLLPGNHDAALSESVWTRARRLDAVPGHVHLATTPSVIELDKQSLAILPAPLTQRHTHNDLTQWFDHADTRDGLLRIGLAHGSVQGILQEQIDSPNPIAPDRADRARLDYLALGDWHGCREINPRTWYSGTPEQDRFRGNEPGQVLLVEIDHSGATPSVTPHPVGRYQWQKQQARLAVDTDLEQLITELERIQQHQVIELTLEGQISLQAQQRLQHALGQAEARCRVLDIRQEALTLAPTEQDISQLQADGYVGQTIAELRHAQENGTEPDTARHALAILTSLLADRQTSAATHKGASQ